MATGFGDECDDYDGLDNETGDPNGETVTCNHADLDGDGIPDEADPCPLLASSMHSLSDLDGDGVPNACDRCVGYDDLAVDWSNGQDSDGDGWPNGCDNCPEPNESQSNCNIDVELSGAPESIRGDACNLTGTCATPTNQLTSHYSAGRIEEVRGLLPALNVDVTRLIAAALLPSRVCPECVRPFPMPLLTRECSFSGRVCVPFYDGSMSLEEPIPTGIDQSLTVAWKNRTDLTWLSAAEPAETLQPGAVRFAAYNATTRRIEMIAVGTEQNLDAINTWGGPLQDAFEGSQLVLSGNSAQVLAVGGLLNGVASNTLRRVDLLTGARS